MRDRVILIDAKFNESIPARARVECGAIGKNILRTTNFLVYLGLHKRTK